MSMPMPYVHVPNACMWACSMDRGMQYGHGHAEKIGHEHSDGHGHGPGHGQDMDIDYHGTDVDSR